MTIKRITIALAASIVIYTSTFVICRATGSGVLSSGPLDWMFSLLVAPGFYVAERVGIKSEIATLILCWALYAPLFGAVFDLGIKLIRRRRFS